MPSSSNRRTSTFNGCQAGALLADQLETSSRLRLEVTERVTPASVNKPGGLVRLVEDAPLVLACHGSDRSERAFRDGFGRLQERAHIAVGVKRGEGHAA